MAHSALSALVALASLTLVAGQTTPAPAVSTFPATPLTNIRYAYTDLPERVITETYVRGTQSGYNLCNSSTQNQNSMCQTLLVNNASDFCFFAPPTPNTAIADSEGLEVTWCTDDTHGSRTVPPGTITGLQWLNNANYIQIVAFIQQTNVNMLANDSGGELDCGGQDENGNPMGGMVYGNQPNGTGPAPQQYPWWTEFIGGGVMAMKVCNPTGPNPTGYCQHTLDRIGIQYNMPNKAQNGTFEVCDTDAMAIPGEYVVNGVTSSYAQPAESVPITSVPYTPSIPASSNCVTYQSSAIFSSFASLFPTTSGASSPTATGSGKNGASGSRSGSAASATSTSGSNGAGVVTISLFSSILGVAFSIAFLA
jgi:hypothetical protein